MSGPDYSKEYVPVSDRMTLNRASLPRMAPMPPMTEAAKKAIDGHEAHCTQVNEKLAYLQRLGRKFRVTVHVSGSSISTQVEFEPIHTEGSV